MQAFGAQQSSPWQPACHREGTSEQVVASWLSLQILLAIAGQLALQTNNCGGSSRTERVNHHDRGSALQDAQLERCSRKREALAKQVAELGQDMKNVHSKFEAAQQQADELRGQLTAAQAQAQAAESLRQELSAAQRKLEAAQKDSGVSAELQKDLAAARARIEAAESQHAEATAKLREEGAAMERRVKALQAEMHGTEAKLAKLSTTEEVRAAASDGSQVACWGFVPRWLSAAVGWVTCYETACADMHEHALRINIAQLFIPGRVVCRSAGPRRLCLFSMRHSRANVLACAHRG